MPRPQYDASTDNNHGSIKTQESLWIIEWGQMDTIPGGIRGGSHISSPWPLSVCTIAVVTTVEIDPGTQS